MRVRLSSALKIWVHIFEARRLCLEPSEYPLTVRTLSGIRRFGFGASTNLAASLGVSRTGRKVMTQSSPRTGRPERPEAYKDVTCNHTVFICPLRTVDKYCLAADDRSNLIDAGQRVTTRQSIATIFCVNGTPASRLKSVKPVTTLGGVAMRCVMTFTRRLTRG